MSEKVVILGASDKPERFAYKAMVSLKKHNHEPILVSRNLTVIEGQSVFADLAQIPKPVDTLTVYVTPNITSELKDKIIELNPKRVIFNPRTENPRLETELKAAGIEVVNACTLVMLATGRY